MVIKKYPLGIILMMIFAAFAEPMLAQKFVPLQGYIDAETQEQNQEQEELAESDKTDADEKSIEDVDLPEEMKEVQVSILLYHDFSLGKETDMKISVQDFREQMQKIKDRNLSVISMKDFLAWKEGEKIIPKQSVVITIDDGWQEIYTLALPILKDFGYPFTVFLYTNYVGIGGRSLEVSQIKKMLNLGAEIGSHSISHRSLRKPKSMSDERYQEFLRREIMGSKKWLEDKFNLEIDYFSYPYGIMTDEAIEIGKQAGYKLLFSVNPAKNRWDTPITEINRYIISGLSSENFEKALMFSNMDKAKINPDEELPDASKIKPKLNQTIEKYNLKIYPESGQTIADRMPTISVVLANLPDYDVQSIEMYLGGIGRVPVIYERESQQIAYTLQRKIRTKEQKVIVKINRNNGEPYPTIRWSFNIEQEALYHDIIQSDGLNDGAISP